MVAKFAVDLNKPLVAQVGHPGEAYDEWLHQPILSKEGPRFFANDYVERDLTPTQIAAALVSGLSIWTLIEYCLQRFILHIKTQNHWVITFHYLFHGCHHKHPMDSLRTVFPPTVTALFCVPFYGFFRLLSTASVAPALFCGVLMGYTVYDVTHYYLVVSTPRSAIHRCFERAEVWPQKYHLNHHSRVQTMGFGITTSFWDTVFGTKPQVSTQSC